MKLRYIPYGVLDPSLVIPGKASGFTGAYYWMDREYPLLLSGVLQEPVVVGGEQGGLRANRIDTDATSREGVRNLVLNTNNSHYVKGIAVLTNTVVFRLYFPKYSLLATMQEGQFIQAASLTAVEDCLLTISPNLQVHKPTKWELRIAGGTIAQHVISSTGHSLIVHLDFDNELAQSVIKENPDNVCYREQPHRGVKEVLPNVTADTLLMMYPAALAKYLDIPLEHAERSEEEHAKYDVIRQNGVDLKDIPIEDDLCIYRSNEVNHERLR